MIAQRHCLVVLKSICSFMVLVLLASCLPEPLDVKNIPKVKPQIVVSTQLIPDETLLVLLTRTFNALDYTEDSDPEQLLEQIAVNDALVTITGSEGTDTLRFLESGLYGDVFIPFREGEVYELRIRSETLGEVYATTRVQAKVPLADADVELYYNGFGDTLALINYSVEDPAANNWYMLNVQKFQKEKIEQNLLNPKAFTKLVDDTEFNGQLFQDMLQFEADDFAPGDTIAVSLANISEEYYRFMKLRLDNRLNLMDFLGEPVNYPSNIAGGKGYFNLYTPDVRIFVLKESEE